MPHGLSIDDINSAIHDRRAGGYPEGIGSISDGYHTFDELYAHRIALFKHSCKQEIQLADFEQRPHNCWKSKTHADGSIIPGWFIAGMYTQVGKQISYHIPISEWDSWPGTGYVTAPEWDGHTSADVINRLKNVI